MCEYCHSFPHLEGCPEYEPEDYGICKICGRPILKDEEYVELVYEVAHLDCVVEKIESDPREALAMLRVDYYTAGE